MAKRFGIRRLFVFSLAFVLVNLLPVLLALAAGHVFNENFSVLTPRQSSRQEAQAFAEQVLLQADNYRKEIALEWFGEELPPGAGRTMINVSFSDEDSGLTWAIDGPRRKYHMLYLSTSPQRALGSTLKHEVVHLVLATRYPYPNRLPAWLEEGIASRYDDERRIARRTKITDWFVETEKWPRLERVLSASSVTSSDSTAYTTATSLVEFLLSRSDKKTLFKLGAQASSERFDDALKRLYGIRDRHQLQTEWQTWLRRSKRAAVASRSISKTQSR